MVRRTRCASTQQAAIASTTPASYPGGTGSSQDFCTVDLSEIPVAATLIHHGCMDNVLASTQALARWVDASGCQSLGYARELTLKLSDVRDDWVTELQEPIAPNRSAPAASRRPARRSSGTT
jgi:hypothetical protein